MIIITVLLVDQVSKVLVKTNMTLGQSIPVLGDWFIIHFTENAGMAFGFEFSGQYGKLILSIFRILAVGFITVYLAQIVKKGASAGLITCVSLILAGALGNIIDSVFYGVVFSASYFNQAAVAFPEGGGYAALLHGNVVDMLYFPLIQTTLPSWFPFWGGEEFIFFRPVFNVADSSITMGVFILLVFQRRFFRHEEPTQENETVTGDQNDEEAEVQAEAEVQNDPETEQDNNPETEVQSAPETEVQNDEEIVL